MWVTSRPHILQAVYAKAYTVFLYIYEYIYLLTHRNTCIHLNMHTHILYSWLFTQGATFTNAFNLP